jgi:glycosyltransferase involved in cell wall biosynthesis
VDEFNGIGYGTFFIRNSVLLIHQMYGEFWSVELGPAGRIFEILERQFLKLYRKKPTITISASTAADLGLLGFQNITIITDGLEVTPLTTMPEKKDQLTMVYLGRIKKTKNPEDVVKAFLIVQKTIPDACLRVVGDGPFLPDLREKYRDNSGISFYGFVDFKKKYELMTDAHFLLVPSIREGWGQIVIQANAVGTPVIGYNVRGLRDSICHGKTGILVNNFKEMAEQIIMLWNDGPKRDELGRNALDWAHSFSYGKMRSDFVKYINNLPGGFR